MLTDDEIVRRVKGGERQAFEDLIERHEAALYAYARSRVRGDAEEITQDSFVEAYLSLHRYQEGTDFGAWLRAICRNLIRNRLRSLSRRREAAFLEAALDLEGGEAPPELPLAALRECIAKLDVLARRLVDGFYRNSRSLAQLARLTGMTFTAVGVALHRARYRLRDCLRRAGVEDLA